MPYTPPAYDALVAQLVALAQSKVQVSVGGVLGQPDLTEGSDILTQIESQAFLADFFNAALAQFYTDHDFDQAIGAALANLLAPRGLRPLPAGYAIAPVLCGRNTQSPTLGQPVVIPAAIPATPTTAGQAGYRFLAADQTGAYTIAFQAMQNPYLPAGQAGVIPAGASATWVLALAEVAGAAGNVAAGAIRGIGSAVLAGLDTVSNPPVSSTAAPVIGQGGTPGAATNQYAVVARGQQGRALMSAAGTTTTAPAVLTAVNDNTVTWQPVDNASGYDVLTLVGASWMLLGAVGQSTTSLNDTGQTPQAYSVPLVADANAGAGGTDAESDTAFRARALATATAGGGGGGSDGALVAAALGIAGVTAAFVVDNPTAGTCALSYVAQPNPFPPLLAQQLGAQVDQAAAAGAMTTVQQLTPTPVAVAYTYVPTRNAPATTISNVNAAIAAYFGTLAPGQAVRDSTLAAAMVAAGGSGLDHLGNRVYTVTGGGTFTNTDAPGQAGLLFAIGPITVTTGA